MKQDYCGRCHSYVQVEHDGSDGTGDPDIMSPWVFVPHNRERRVERMFLGMEDCPGSGENSWITQHSS